MKIRYTSQFKKDYKRIKKRGYNITMLEQVITFLQLRKPLPPIYRDHALIGNFNGFRECHIQPNWLLIYKIEDEELLLTLTRTGTHSDLFK